MTGTRRVFWAAMLTLASSAPAEPYEWPLTLPRIITSSFGEFRPGRCHAGIDLRTGPVGQAVLAPEEGYVSRVRCSPWGYGKAVYLTLGDGYTVVYGHLNEFAPTLRDFVRRAQHTQKSYTVDLFLEPGQMVFRRGEVVAFSGKTGVGAPHLHYEIRDPANQPINPRLLGISWPDDTPPVILKTLIAPRDPESSVNGDLVPVIAPAEPVAPGLYRCEPVTASGWIGFGAEVVDPANNGNNRLGVRVLRTLIEETEWFRVQHDRVSYDTIHNGAVAWHPYLLSKGTFLLQWRWPGNALDAFRAGPGEGWFQMPDEPTTVRLEAEDFLGNKAAVEIALRPEEKRPVPEIAAPPSGNGVIKLDCWGAWLLVTAEFPHPEPETPVIRFERNGVNQDGAFQRVGPARFRYGYEPPKDVTLAAFRVLHPRLADSIHTLAVFHRGVAGEAVSFGEVRLRAQRDSAYGVLFASVQESPTTPSNSLRILGKSYRIWPQSAPIDALVEVEIPFPTGADQPGRVAVYRASGSSWTWQKTQRRGDRLATTTRQFGTFVAIEDIAPPTLKLLDIPEEARMSPRPIIQANVADVGSGIDDITVTANGRWLLFEYDPEEELIEWARDEDLPVGPLTLVFSATDRAGNRTILTRRIHVEPTPSVPDATRQR